MKQWTKLAAASDFTMKCGRSTLKVRQGDRFTVTSPEHNNGVTVLIDREQRARLNIGYAMTREDLGKYFTETV